MKKIIIGIVFGIITASLVYAAGISSDRIIFDNSHAKLKTSNNEEVTDVQTAIDVLNNKAEDPEKAKDKTCEVIYGDKNTIGSKFICDLGDNVDRIFYVLKVNTNDVELIMDRNINIGMMNWNDAMAYFTSGAGVAIKNSWTRAINVKIPDATEIANAVGNTSWNVNTATTSNYFYLDPNNGTYGTTQVASADKISAYSWLYEYTKECNAYGCIKNNNLHTYADGYWTSSLVSNVSWGAWVVYNKGYLYTCTTSVTYLNGVRPVVTVYKSNI